MLALQTVCETLWGSAGGVEGMAAAHGRPVPQCPGQTAAAGYLEAVRASALRRGNRDGDWVRCHALVFTGFRE